MPDETPRRSSVVEKPSSDGLTFTDLHDLAVYLVDCRYGYTYEFTGSPVAHLAEYDDLEAFLRRLTSGRYWEIGFGDSEETMNRYATPFNLPRCESRHREGKRSWRCVNGIEHQGEHSAGSGGARRWR